MSETFTLNFLFKDVQQEVTCTLRASAYTYQFLCTVGNSELILEKDDEGNLRALDADPFSRQKTQTRPGPGEDTDRGNGKNFAVKAESRRQEAGGRRRNLFNVIAQE